MFLQHRGLNHLIFLVIITISVYFWITRGLRIGKLYYWSDYDENDETDFDNTKLVKFIKTNHLTPPSTNKYNLSHPGSNHANSFSMLVTECFGKTKKGVFIEAGAWDGEQASNTLQLELMGWKGILVECNPQILPNLMNKNRKAWIADVCLSTTGKAGTVKFYSAPEWTPSAQINKPLNAEEMKIHGIDWMKNKTWIEFERPSFTLQSIIAAIGEFQEIDFLSLDVQGAEIGVLKNYPFELFPIKMMIVEVFTFNSQEKDDLRNFIISKGYTLYKDFGSDYVFVLNQCHTT